jgi:hypothetical protein
VQNRGILEFAGIERAAKPPGNGGGSRRHVGGSKGKVREQSEAVVVRVVGAVIIWIMPPGRLALFACQPHLDGIADPLHPDEEQEHPEDYSRVPSHDPLTSPAAITFSPRTLTTVGHPTI